MTTTEFATLTRPSVADIGAATPADRDRVVDLVRGAAMLVVAMGHWIIAVVTVGPDGGIVGSNALAEVPLLQRLTWVLQVMPLFFLVGGVANATSWRSATRRGDPWGTWMRGRVDRLVRPTAVFVAAWTVLALALTATGLVASEVLALGATLVAVPLWFLAVYVVVVALTPVGLRLHDRFGFAVPVALSAIAVLVDVAHRVGVPAIGWTAFLLVWLVPQHLGFAWLDGRYDSGRTLGPMLVLAGLGALVLLTSVGPYPVSMVGVPGEAASNNSPPTPALIALTVLQLGLLLTARRRLDSWLRRPRVWAGVVMVTARAMTVYLWHLTALVAVAALLVAPGYLHTPAAGTAAWWATRPLWVGLLTLALIPIVVVAGRVERGPSRAQPASTVRVVVTVVALGLAFALLATDGFHVPARPLGLPVPALAAMTVALIAHRPRRAPRPGRD